MKDFRSSPNGLRSVEYAFSEAEKAHRMLLSKPYGVGDGRLWLEGHMSKLDPKIHDPYASQVEKEIDAYVGRVVREEVDSWRRVAERLEIEAMAKDLAISGMADAIKTIIDTWHIPEIEEKREPNSPYDKLWKAYRAAKSMIPKS